jgi:outer membrane murein-binding lipoprotein Lpp
MAIAAAALRVGSMLAKTGGAIAKGGKMAMKKGGTVLKKSKKVAGNVKKAVAKKRKINRETFMSDERTRKKKLEQDKRREEEEALEQSNKSKKKPSAKKSVARGGGILQKIIDFISTILIGWVVTNLPKIIDTVKGVIKKIKEIYNNITGFFGSFGEFFDGIRDAIGNTLNKIKNIDFSNIGNKIKEKITGLKEAFTNLIGNIKKGLGIVNSKKNQDPKKLAQSGFGGDSTAKINNSSKKVDNKNSDIDTLNKDTNKLMSETNKTESDLNKSLKKAESVVNKLDVNVSINQIKESGTVEQIQSIKKDASNIDTPTNKSLISDENSSSDQIKKVKSNVPETIKNVTKDGSKFISNVKKADITKSITKEKKPKNIVVDNIIPSQMIPQNQEGGKTKVIVLGKSLNSMVKENILLDAAYT